MTTNWSRSIDERSLSISSPLTSDSLELIQFSSHVNFDRVVEYNTRNLKQNLLCRLLYDQFLHLKRFYNSLHNKFCFRFLVLYSTTLSKLT